MRCVYVGVGCVCQQPVEEEVVRNKQTRTSIVPTSKIKSETREGIVRVRSQGYHS
jgi:hypothetical protein